MPASSPRVSYKTSTVEASASTTPSSVLRASSRLRSASNASAGSAAASPSKATPRKRTRGSVVPQSTSLREGATPDGSGRKRRLGADGEALWNDELDVVLKKGLALVPNIGKRTVAFEGDDEETYGRNGLLSEYIRRQTGKVRNRVQVASHFATWRRQDPDNKTLAALILGHSVPPSTISKTDWSALLGPDSYPSTLSALRAANTVHRNKQMARRDRAAGAKADGGESSGLSSVEDSEEEEEEEEEKPVKKARRRSSLAPISSPVAKKAPTPRARPSLPRGASSRASLAVDATSTEEDSSDDEEDEEEVDGGKEQQVSATKPKRKYTRRAPVASASATASTSTNPRQTRTSAALMATDAAPSAVEAALTTEEAIHTGSGGWLEGLKRGVWRALGY